MPKRSNIDVGPKHKYDAIVSALANKKHESDIYRDITMYTPSNVAQAPQGVMTRRSSRTYQRPLLDILSTDMLECIMEILLCKAEAVPKLTKGNPPVVSSEKKSTNPLRKVALVVDELRLLDDRHAFLKGFLSLSACCRQLHALSQRNWRRMYAIAMTDSFDTTQPRSFLREAAMSRVLERSQFSTWVQVHRRKALHCANPRCWCFNRRSDCLDHWRDISNIRPGMFSEFEVNLHNDTPLYIDNNASGTHVLCDIDEMLWDIGMMQIVNVKLSYHTGKRRCVVKLPREVFKSACAMHVSNCNQWLVSFCYKVGSFEELDQVYSSITQVNGGIFPKAPFFVNHLTLARLKLNRSDREVLQDDAVAHATTALNQALQSTLAQIRTEYKCHLRSLLDDAGAGNDTDLLQYALRDTLVNEAMQYCNASVFETSAPTTGAFGLSSERVLELVLCVRPDYWTQSCKTQIVACNVYAYSTIHIRYGLTSKQVVVNHSNEFGCLLRGHLTFGKSHQVDFAQDGLCYVATTFQYAQNLSPLLVENGIVGEYLVLKVHLPPPTSEGTSEWSDRMDPLESPRVYSFLCKEIPVRSADPSNCISLVMSKVLWACRRRGEMAVFVLVCKNANTPTECLQAIRLLLNTNEMSITTLDTYILKPFIPQRDKGLALDTEGLQVSVAPSGERVLVTAAAEDVDDQKSGGGHGNEETEDEHMNRMYGWMLDYGVQNKVIKSFYPRCKNYHNLAWFHQGLSSTLQGGTLVFDMPATKAFSERTLV